MLCDRRPRLIAPMMASCRLTGTPTVPETPVTVGGSPSTFFQHASSDRLIDRVSAFLSDVTKSTSDGLVQAPKGCVTTDLSRFRILNNDLLQ